MNYLLKSKAQNKEWGPFPSELIAWKYLFGRNPSEDEISLYKDAGWCVVPTIPNGGEILFCDNASLNGNAIESPHNAPPTPETV